MDKGQREIDIYWPGEENEGRTAHSQAELLQKRRALRRKKRRRQQRIIRMTAGTAALLLAAGLGFGLYKIGQSIWRYASGHEQTAAFHLGGKGKKMPKPEMTEDFLTPNEFSRPGEPLTSVDDIFIHYTANAGTSAAQNRSYFENLGITGETSASAHFVIGYEGEIIQCLPLNEIGYAVKEHNYNSVSIECCYLEESGKFTEETYQSLVELTGWLMGEYGLDISCVGRHYDTCGKLCPLYYVEHEEAWEQFLADLENYVEEA